MSIYVYVYPEFVQVVKKSNSEHMNVLQLTSEDILAWEGGQSQAKLRKEGVKLAEMVEIQLRRGSRELHYKGDHDEAEFSPLDFLKKKFTFQLPEPLRDGCRGIEPVKKEQIIQKLCPMMPENRRSFWNTLETSDVSEDLK